MLGWPPGTRLPSLPRPSAGAGPGAGPRPGRGLVLVVAPADTLAPELDLVTGRLCPGLEAPPRPGGGRDLGGVGAPAGLLGGCCCCCWEKGEVTCGGRALLLQ